MRMLQIKKFTSESKSCKDWENSVNEENNDKGAIK